jgi:hypothetical protein
MKAVSVPRRPVSEMTVFESEVHAAVACFTASDVPAALCCR